jgi:outer membrane immunogenic protein
MKKKLLAAAAALGTFAAITPASAADMALKAPPPPVVWDWTGGYVGANVGYSWGDWKSSSLAAIFPGGLATASPNVDGWLGGFQAGYNWQASPQWVLGIEGDFQWTGESASDPYSDSISFPSGIGTGICDAHPICTETVTTTGVDNWKLPWFATLRGRAGYLVDPTFLIYGTGGLAVGGTQFSNVSTTTATVTNSIGQVFPGFPVTTSAAFSGTEDRLGFAVGAGVEKKFAQNWSVKAEYLFLDFGSYTFLAGTGVDTNVQLYDNIFRVGLNYQFSGPAAAH